MPTLDDVRRIAEALLLHESLTGSEVESIIAGEPFEKLRSPAEPSRPASPTTGEEGEPGDEIGPGRLTPEVAY